MTVLPLLKKWLGIESSRLDPLVEVVRSAQDDPQIRNSLITVLRLPGFQRHSALGSLHEELRIKQAPPVLLNTIGLLQDDELAERTLNLLEAEGS